jgi:hypothetical protein
MKWFEQLKVYLFPPVNRNAALDIAKQKLALPMASEPLICHGRKPSHFHIYANLPEPCWWIQVPWGDGKEEVSIRNSRVIVVGRQSGKVFYDGSAGDEG